MQTYGYAVLPLLGAFVIVVALMPFFIRWMRTKHMGQTIYELGPQTHMVKQGTPNMGGVITAAALIVCMIVCEIILGANAFSLKHAFLPLLFVAISSMAIGFADDGIKVLKHRHEGLTPKQKIIGQVAVGLMFSVCCYFTVGSDVILPFTAATWDLGIFYIPIMTVLVVFMTNSANLQDGLDGILSTVTVIGMAAFAVCALILTGSGVLEKENGVIIFSGACALAGASLGFLVFNHYPAKIFMGDTGSMLIGGMMVGIAMLTKCQFLLLTICFTCVMSSVSVILQTGYFKYTKKKTGTGKRIFKMSPIHHHFEKCGMSEVRIVRMYAIITVITGVIAVLSLCAYFG